MKFSTVLTSLIISSFFKAVVGVVTLRLSGDPIYGQSFSLVCYATTVPLRFATFYRKHIESDINISSLEARLGTVSITTCEPESVSLTRYNFSCSSDEKEISLIVPAENLMEHNTVWKCTNAEGPFVINNNNLTVFVNVPVSSLQLIPNGNVSIDEFETNKFTCTTSFCRPQATISWWKNNVSITNTADIPTYDQNFTIGSLNYTGNRQDNGHIIVCKASNGYGLERTSQQSVVLNVRYPPVVTPFQSPVRVVEGSPLEVVCRSDGNPISDYTWDPLGEDIENRSRLYYHNITRNNSGTYRCKASSTMRPTNGNPVNVSDSKDVVIDVLYRASISAFITKENNNTIMENDSLLLHCQVNSNPLSDIFLYYEDNNLLKEEKNALNLNYTKKAECLDAGVFTCHANNSIMNGYSASSDLQIMVACSPRFDHRKNVSTVYYTGLNSNVTLEVYVIAYPEPANITWHHRENETDMWQRVTYQPPVSGGLSSRILIQLTSQLDFGYYMVTLGNYLGKYNKTYSIIPESIPGVPKNINVTKRGPHSVTLEWAPGFAGGHPQHFIIEYARQSDEDWIKSDEISDVESPMQSYILSGLQPKTFYQLRMYAENKIGLSEKTQVVTATTLEASTHESLGISVPGIAGGIVAGFVVILCLVIGIFLWRRYQHAKQNKHENDIKRECEERSQIKDSPVKQDAVSRKVYEGLHFTEVDASQYQELNDIALEENRNANIRPPENDSYEKLHPYTNSDIQMYSSLTNPKTSKDSDEK